jgi:hypothetical protein
MSDIDFTPESGDGNDEHDAMALFNALADSLADEFEKITSSDGDSKTANSNREMTLPEKLQFLQKAATASTRWKNSPEQFATQETDIGVFIALTLHDHTANTVEEMQDEIKFLRRGFIWLSGAVALASIGSIILSLLNLV